jgi:hypothetical protein
MTETTTAPSPDRVRQALALELPSNDAGASTVGDYLTKLLLEVWKEEEDFDGKRPFGNSGWQHELGGALGDAGLLANWPGSERADAGERTNTLVLAAIRALGQPPAPVAAYAYGSLAGMLGKARAIVFRDGPTHSSKIRDLTALFDAGYVRHGAAEPAAGPSAKAAPPAVVVAALAVSGGGLVLRWYRNVDTARAGGQFAVIAASGSGVTLNGGSYLHDIPAGWIADANRAYELLKARRVADARAMATHEPGRAFRGEIVEIQR